MCISYLDIDNLAGFAIHIGMCIFYIYIYIWEYRYIFCIKYGKWIYMGSTNIYMYVKCLWNWEHVQLYTRQPQGGEGNGYVSLTDVIIYYREIIWLQLHTYWSKTGSRAMWRCMVSWISWPTMLFIYACCQLTTPNHSWYQPCGVSN